MLLHPHPGIRRTILIGVSLALLVLGSSLLAVRAHGEQTASVIEVAGQRVLDQRRACTWVSGVRNWSEVDREHLIVDGPGTRERFLIPFSGACASNPRFVTDIGVISRDSRLCGTDGDMLVIDGRRCTVLEMWKLAPAESASPAAGPTPG